MLWKIDRSLRVVVLVQGDYVIMDSAVCFMLYK